MFDWQDLAACKGMGTNLFFPGPEEYKQREEAKAICETCPVKSACLEDAFHSGRLGHFGVRGGLSELERARLFRQRRTRARVLE